MLLFKIDVNLQKLSLIAIAARFWQPRNIKNEIRKFFEGSEDKSRERWINSVASYVAFQVDFLDLPEKLKPKIKNYVFILGGSMFNFIHHVTKNGFDIDFGLNIIWTSYGRIDEVSMAKRSLVGHCDVEPLPDCYLSLADIYTDEDLVRVNMRALRAEEETKDPVARIGCDKAFSLAMIGHELYRHKKFNSFNSNEYKFLYCFYKNKDFPFAARYFWNFLSDIEKEVCVVYAAEEFHSNCYRNVDYLQQKHAETLLFFLTQMDSEMGFTFISSNFGLFGIDLQTWPLRELSVNIVRSMIDYYGEHSELRFTVFLDFVLNCLLSNTIAQVKIANFKIQSHHHDLLQELLNIIPEEDKFRYFAGNMMYFVQFHQRFDFMTLSIIVKDHSLIELREKIISTGYGMFKYLIKRGYHSEIQRYKEFVLSDDNEKKMFEERLSRIKDEAMHDSEWLFGAEFLEMW